MVLSTKCLVVAASTNTVTARKAVRSSLATTRLVVRETRWHGRSATALGDRDRQFQRRQLGGIGMVGNRKQTGGWVGSPGTVNSRHGQPCL